jgi:hypothetical protein
LKLLVVLRELLDELVSLLPVPDTELDPLELIFPLELAARPGHRFVDLFGLRVEQCQRSAGKTR